MSAAHGMDEMAPEFDRPPTQANVRCCTRGQTRLVILQEPGDDTWTAMHTAAQKNDVDGINDGFGAQYRYEVSALDVQDVHGWTPLHVAAGDGSQEAVETLFRLGAGKDIQDAQGWAPLHYAARFGHVGIVDVLIQYGAQTKWPDLGGVPVSTTMHIAAQAGQVDVVRYLTTCQTTRCWLLMRDSNGVLPLHLAAESGNPGVVEAFRDCGVFLDLPDDLGRTALHLAVEHNRVAACADDPCGYLPLHIAAMRGDANMVESLLAHPSSVLVKDDGNRQLQRRAVDERARWSGETALHLAAEYGHSVVVKTLLEHGARAQAHTGLFHTALHLAAIKGHAEVAIILLDPKCMAAVNRPYA